MSTVKSKKLQVGTDATSSNNFTIYQPATPDGTLRIGVGNADSPTEVGRFNANGYVATNAPAFSAYNNGTQSVSASTDTKVVFDHENFDTNSNYDNATNYRFTPTVAGYYQFNTNVYVANFGGSWMRIYIMKNGSANTEFDRTITAGQTTLNGSCILYANGTTDYFEIYIKCQGGTTVQVGANDANLMTFNATLVRAS